MCVSNVCSITELPLPAPFPAPPNPNASPCLPRHHLRRDQAFSLGIIFSSALSLPTIQSKRPISSSSYIPHVLSPFISNSLSITLSYLLLELLQKPITTHYHWLALATKSYSMLVIGSIPKYRHCFIIFLKTL